MAGERRARRAAIYVVDPSSGAQAELRRVGPLAAEKTYHCPGCNQTIAPRTGHVVIVPLSEPDARRHWHTSCWEHRHRRRPGR